MPKKEPFLFGAQFAEYFKSMVPGSHEASGGKEIVCRCRYCADSIDPNHGHMYVHVPQDKEDAPTFHCFKCQTSGVLDSRRLMEWGLYDPSLAVEIDKINKAAVKANKFQGYDRVWYPFNNGIQDIDLANTKLEYINNRIGTNLTLSECMKQKIIFNLKEAIDYNNLPYYRHQNIMDQFNRYFVGFLSLDNNFVNLRRVCDEGIVYEKIDKRYVNYNIHDKKDNTEKMYVMPTQIDLTIPRKVNIHIAEGPFDILSIRYNLRNGEPGIYAAITGSGYKGLVMHLITTFELFYFDLHLYPDNDNFGSDYAMNQINELIKPYGATLYIHRNMSPGEKDFGVPLDRIKEQVYLF